jgi:predicted amidohydrolase YtcJ
MHGFQVNVHAIGDAAVRMVLDVYEEFLVPGNDLRWRIEHAQIVHPNDIPRFGRLAVIPSIQTTHATSDYKWVPERLGAARMSRAYPHRALLDQNGWLPTGSDFPIESIQPTRGFHSAVTRKNDRGEPKGGFQPENRFTREEALKAMTTWAARANFEETQRGSLSRGKVADFTVLDTDLASASEVALREPTVLATALAGKLVYEKH